MGYLLVMPMCTLPIGRSTCREKSIGLGHALQLIQIPVGGPFIIHSIPVILMMMTSHMLVSSNDNCTRHEKPNVCILYATYQLHKFFYLSV